MRKPTRLNYREVYSKILNPTPTDKLQYALIRAVKESFKGEQTAETLARTYIAQSLMSEEYGLLVQNLSHHYHSMARFAAMGDQPFSMLGVNIKKLLTPREIEALDFLSLQVKPEDMKREYVYIFVRQDISNEYQLVQASHATLVLGHALATSNKYDVSQLYFSVIGVANQDELFQAVELIKAQGGQYRMFLEPDMPVDQGQYTAVAAFPVSVADREPFFKYSRLRFD